jgi:hypothetical protein
VNTQVWKSDLRSVRSPGSTLALHSHWMSQEFSCLAGGSQLHLCCRCSDARVVVNGTLRAEVVVVGHGPVACSGFTIL